MPENKIAVLIPAYQPDEKLLALVRQLTDTLPVLLVDDGSAGCGALFAAAEQAGCTVLHHPKNLGKGRALKTGLDALARAGFTGAVTADADGQHTAADIRRVAAALAEHPDRLVLGVRDTAQMPPRSRTGNRLTVRLFALLYGICLTDTQTGLRGIPLQNIAALLALRGERYEYEMNQLVRSRALFGGITELPIDTIYLADNASSHFRPLRDGMKIYAVLFTHLPGFLVASLLSFALDYSLFSLFYLRLLHNVVLSTLCGRVLSGAFNFTVNKRFVFKSTAGRYSFWRYLALAICILAVNCTAMFVLVNLLHGNALLCKVLVECTLYLVSFAVQNNFAHAQAARANADASAPSGTAER